MPTDLLQLIDITPDRLDEVLRIRARSFGHDLAADVAEWRKEATEKAEARRFLGVVAGDTLVAAARLWDFRQWWGGRPVPMGGVAGVVVAPEYRGRGVGSLLMRGVLDRSREFGDALSALYPATVPVYRRVGYEFGGGRYRFSFPAGDLRTLGGKDVAVRQGGPDDAARLLELVAQVRSAGHESGMLGWPVSKVREWLAADTTFCYLADDGFVVYAWDGSDLRVDELVAGSGQTARALWATVGSGSSIARTVHAIVAPHDPIHLLLGTEAESGARIQRWMLRILDAPAAIGARGWSPAVRVSVGIEVDDAEVTDNAGRWQLTVADGNGRLDRREAGGRPDDGSAAGRPDRGSGAGGNDRVDSGSGVLRLSARGLAALYAGTPVAALRISGLATGGSAADDQQLDAAFAGATPYMLDFF